MDIQNLIDVMMSANARERSNYHLRLGEFIEVLKSADASDVVRFDVGGSPARPHSYRGYYSDLSFEVGGDASVREVLELAESCLGETFEGYKGGDFVMTEQTPLWRAPYGCTGLAVISAVKSSGSVILVTKDVG